MNEHYSDYVKKNIPHSDIVFDKIEEKDKALVKTIHGQHIKNNLGTLILFTIGFIPLFWFFARSLFIRLPNVFFDILTLVLIGGALVALGYFIYDVIGPFKGIRKGIVLASERIQEVKDNKNVTYQYVFDIYLPDTDQTLMSYQVSREVFECVNPGDGIVIYKTLRKVKALPDPERKGVMDVSKIKSGVR